MSRVVCVGSANVDVTLYVDKLGMGNSEQSVGSIEVCSGGSAANIASGIGRLGKHASFFGNLGNDGYTQMLQDDFNRDNVDYSFAVRTDKPNNTCYVFVDPHGSRQMYAYNNVEFSAGDFPEELLKSSYIVFASLTKEGIVNEYANIAGKAKKQNAKIVLAPGGIFARMGFQKLKALLELCDYVILNADEFGMLGPELAKVVPRIIVTDGEKNIRYYHNGVKEFPVKKSATIDTTGAGDCFAAAFLAAMVDGKNEEDAIKFASAAASLSVLDKGPRAMPHIEKIMVF